MTTIPLGSLSADANVFAGSVEYDETDSGTAVALTDAVLVINYFVK
jgi:hypothetical protein